MSQSVVSSQQQQPNFFDSQNKLPLGKLLQQAGLISENQLQLALQNQTIPGYETFKIGEILALRGWVKQETSDFFATRWQELCAAAQVERRGKKIGDYLAEANLLSDAQIHQILESQQRHRELFGRLAVAQGFLKQQTVDFFVQNLLVKNTPSASESRIELCIQRASRYFTLGDIQGAILELREALRLDSSNAHAHAWLARIYLEGQKYPLAKVHLKKAIATNGTDKFVLEVKEEFMKVVALSQATQKVQQPKSNLRMRLKLG